MRLGKILKTVSNVVNESMLLKIESQPLFGGQANIVTNFRSLIEAINLLIDQQWNKTDLNQISDLLKKTNQATEETQLTQDEFNRLNTYVNGVNQQFPIYYSILQKMVEKQEEQIISLKLPTNIKSLSDLSSLNNRLEKLFREFQVDGGFSLHGFDYGTEWYVLLVQGILTYNFFISCLKIAQEFLKTKTEYYKSEKAKLDYEASLEDENKFSETGLEKYTNKRLELFIKNEVSQIIIKISETNGSTRPELTSKLIKATKDLIKELSNGVEFHLSLNPPSYTNENNGMIEINYKSLQAIYKKQLEAEKKPKEIKPPSKKESVETKKEDIK